MFLTIEEITELTGYRRFTAQCRWLAARGYRFETNAHGRPIVLVSSVERRLQPGSRVSQQPNFETLNNG
jgi:hypothetical protein